jgi:accessory colonization factor AcfC
MISQSDICARDICARCVAGLASLAVLAFSASHAVASDVRVYTSGAPAEIQKGFAQRFNEASGHRLVITSGTLAVIQDRLLASEAADVVVLPMPSVDTLTRLESCARAAGSVSRE